MSSPSTNSSPEHSPRRAADEVTAEIAAISHKLGIPVEAVTQGVLGRFAHGQKRPGVAMSLQLLAELSEVGRACSNSDSAFQSWLAAPHPLLRGKTVIQLIANGQIVAARDFVVDAASGQPT